MHGLILNIELYSILIVSYRSLQIGI